MTKKELFQTKICDMAPETEQFHQEMVLLFVLEGSLEVCVESKISNMQTEDVLLINANKRYTMRSARDVLYMELLIDYSVVLDTMKNGDVIFWCDSSVADNERYRDLRVLLRRVLNRYMEQHGTDHNFGYLGECYIAMNYLAANFLIRVNDITSQDENDRYEERIQQINSYIYTNYDQPISMKELSEKLYLSNGYLSRFFKKNYGMSFASYLTNVRIYHAVDDLLYTDVPITRIAYNNGFASAALFNKVFKKAYGQTPSEFRKNSETKAKSTENEKHERELEKRLEKVLADNPEPQPDENRARVTEGSFCVEQFEPLDFSWKKIINFGDATYLLNSSVREHLFILQQALHFEYARFCNIFSKEMFIDVAQEGDFNFSQIDSVIDLVLEQGLRPFIELGFKPKMIHYSIGQMKPADGSYESVMMKITMEQWTRLMTAFMNHLTHRYGQDVLDNWKMELWYDENLRLDVEHTGPVYLKFFEETRRIIKACNENIQFGGYSIRMDVGEKRRKAFLEEWHRQGGRPDFISIMYYGYERGSDGLDRYARQTTDNDALLHLLSREKRLIREAGFEDVPVVVNEWNLTPSVRNYINDTSFKGAYVIKNVIDTYGMAGATGYGAGSDRQYAFYDTTELLFGGTGLITSDGILKPAAFAYDFLNNRLFPYYIGKSRNYLITTDRHDNYSIVCHNQQLLNYNYYLTCETDLDRESMWKYFDGRSKLNLRIRLTDVADGKYKIKIYRINESWGSVMQRWRELDYEKNPSRNDIKYLRRACEPLLQIRRTEAIGGRMFIEEQLAPNEIAVIRVRREM